MHITGTHIAYYHLCHRKLWLFANGINMEHTSELVAEGKMIGEQSYPQRASKWQEIELEGIKIDHFDARRGIVREVKKSNRRDQAHIVQVKYYLFVLERNGIKTDHAILEYPKLRQTEIVRLTETDRNEIPLWEKDAEQIIALSHCPDRINKSLCRHCSYYEFCYAEEL